jgi:Na+-driven multidrug efflux pump
MGLLIVYMMNGSWIPGAGNLLNALLDPILIFLVGLGIGGAAISTVISEYVSNVVNYIMLDVPVSYILLSTFLS